MENKDAGLEGLIHSAKVLKEAGEREDKKHLEGAARDAARCHARKMSVLDWIFRWQRRQRNTRSPYRRSLELGKKLSQTETLVMELKKINSWPWGEE